MDDEVPWLSGREQAMWRRWLLVQSLLPAELHRALHDDGGLSLPDFDVLVQLTDPAEGRVRSSELASLLNWERSRVSHHVARMVKRGLVEREECADDGRGSFVAVTSAGRRAIEGAAPGHVRTVRRLVFDALEPDEIDILDRVFAKVLAAAGKNRSDSAGRM